MSPHLPPPTLHLPTPRNITTHLTAVRQHRAKRSGPWMFQQGRVPLEQPPLGKDGEDGVPWVSSDWASLRTGPFDLNSLKMGLCPPQTGESLKIGCVSSDQGSLSQAMPPLQTLTVTAPRGGWLAELPLSEELGFFYQLLAIFILLHLQIL